MISILLEDFTSCWSVFHHKSRENALRDINSGCCGVAAYCVSYVLQHKGVNPEYWANGWHVWLRLGGIDYDTYRPKGYSQPVCEVWGAPKDFPSPDVDTYITNNSIQAYFIKGFLERHEVPLPEFIKELLRKTPRWGRFSKQGKFREVKPRRIINNRRYRYLLLGRKGEIPFTPLHLSITNLKEHW